MGTLEVLPGSSSETFRASSDGACNISNADDEEDVVVIEQGFIAINEEMAVHVKQEEIAEDITFPDIESEPDDSCTDSLQVLLGSSGETFPTSANGACSFSNIEVEEDIVVIEEGLIGINEDAAVRIKQEENAEDVTFPDIKSEPDEVGYVCVCLVLDTFYLCPEMSFVFVMSVFMANMKQLHCY
jgi:GTP cyclohydrolase II